MATQKKTTQPKNAAAQPLETGEVEFGGTLPILEIRRRLAEPIPTEMVSFRPQAGQQIAYMNVTDCKDLLDQRAGIWESSVVSQTVAGLQLITVVKIRIHAGDGIFEHDGTGFEALNLDTFGDTGSNAFAMAFKRAAESFGLGRELWRGEVAPPENYRSQNRQGAQPPPRSQTGAPPSNAQWNGNPQAASISDMLTSAQRGKLIGSSKDNGLETEAVVEAYFSNIQLDELSKKAASFLIDKVLSGEAKAKLSKLNNAPANTGTVTKGNFGNAAAAPPQGEEKPANESQKKAISSIVQMLKERNGFLVGDYKAELLTVGCERDDDLTFNQARQLIINLNNMLDGKEK